MIVQNKFFLIIFLMGFGLVQLISLNETHTSDDVLLNAMKDETQDSFYYPIQPDPDSCSSDSRIDLNDKSCFETRQSTFDETSAKSGSIEIQCNNGGDDPDARFHEEVIGTSLADCSYKTLSLTDKHWGPDPVIVGMRTFLHSTGSGESIRRHVIAKRRENSEAIIKDEFQHHSSKNKRPPIFLIPGLASTRLIAWRSKNCRLSDIKIKDHVWLNLNLVMQMSTIDVECLSQCLMLGWNQSDSDNITIGCKLRPDEGLDAIYSLSPGGLGSQLLGGTNTVYAWLIQWLADHLGYDVTNIIGLPYDWRLSPDKMESRDGFLTLTRHRIEAAVQSNGGMPGILVAHSMGNLIFRYFLNWLRYRLQQEAFDRMWKQHKKQTVENADQNTSYSAFVGVAGTGLEDAIANTTNKSNTDKKEKRRTELMELAIEEGDDAWYNWIEHHVWTYVGLAAPLLGAVNPVRSVISGESMGLPITDEKARWIELTFGSTHTVNPVSTEEGFCDEWNIKEKWDEEPNKKRQQFHANTKLACMDDIVTEINSIQDNHTTSTTSPGYNPWENFHVLDQLLQKRANWDSDFPMIRVVKEICQNNEKTPCSDFNTTVDFGPEDVTTGKMFSRFSELWKEKDDPLIIKRDQLQESFWNTNVLNILNETWSRPLIKHVVMAYGVDIPTEVGYEYHKRERINKKNISDENRKSEMSFDGIPTLTAILSELEGGQIYEERIQSQPVLGDLIKIKKSKKKHLKSGRFQHSGDGSVPYISLSWAHTWLLHSARAILYTKQKNDYRDHYIQTNNNTSSTIWNPLDEITISHRPKGSTEWVKGLPQSTTPLGDKKVESSSDTGTAYPHGTLYQPEMIQYHSQGTSRTTGMNYTTTVLEAIGVEHKETPR
jgi:Lecithin:cholesterol acyltransferase